MNKAAAVKMLAILKAVPEAERLDTPEGYGRGRRATSRTEARGVTA